MGQARYKDDIKLDDGNRGMHMNRMRVRAALGHDYFQVRLPLYW